MQTARVLGLRAINHGGISLLLPVSIELDRFIDTGVRMQGHAVGSPVAQFRFHIFKTSVHPVSAVWADDKVVLNCGRRGADIADSNDR